MKQHINVDYLDNSLDNQNGGDSNLNINTYNKSSNNNSTSDNNQVNDTIINLNEINSLIQFAINAEDNSEMFHMRMI